MGSEFMGERVIRFVAPGNGVRRGFRSLRADLNSRWQARPEAA